MTGGLPDRGSDRQVGAPAPDTVGSEPGWLVRSEERARVAFPTRVRGRVRLVKHVVAEEVTYTVTLRREELRVEETPGDDPGADLSWTDPLPDDPEARDFEIVLHAEQLVTSTVTVPMERVRVGTRVVETEVEVSTDVRREQLEVDAAYDAPPDRTSALADPYDPDDQPGARHAGPGTPEKETA